MEPFSDLLYQAWMHLGAATPLPDPRAIAIAVLAGMVAVLHRSTWRAAHQLITVAHEGGHALAAFATGRRALRVHVNADGSGTTQSWGSAGGFGTTLVDFAGYPFPALLGAGLLVASSSGDARQWAAVIALALAMLLWRTRNPHGWLVVGVCLIGTAAGAWFLPGVLLALAMAWLGAVLLVGALRSLMAERRLRLAGATGTDVARLGSRGMLPSSVWWTGMAGIVIGCAWIAWGQMAGAYSGL